MPFHAERYPPNWSEISLATRQEAGWRCQFCGAAHGQPNPLTGSRVVLTVAHLDHDTTNSAPENRRALCQLCHLRHDARHHADSAAATRRQRRRDAGQIDLELNL